MTEHQRALDLVEVYLKAGRQISYSQALMEIEDMKPCFCGTMSRICCPRHSPLVKLQDNLL